MTNSNKILAIIVTYNPDPDMLSRQLSSIKDQVDGIIYVDNKSDILYDIGFDVLENVYSISNERNLGLGIAQNQGIKKAFELGASHVLLLDQDSIASHDMVTALVETENKYISRGIKVGLVGPLIIDILSRPPKKSGGIIIKGLRIKRTEPQTSTLEVSYCLASGSLISIDTLMDVGCINEFMFIDSLDLEWCLRAKSKGYSILLEPKGILEHECGNGAQDKVLSHSSFREYYICRNNIVLAKTNYVPFLYRFRLIIMTLGRVIYSLSKGYKEHYKEGVQGLKDGLSSTGLR